MTTILSAMRVNATMLRRWSGALLVALVTLAVLSPVYVMAGPGGQIAKAAFNTTIGRVIMIALVIILLPVIIYFWAREFVGVRKTRKDLAKLAEEHPEFDWNAIQPRVKRMVEDLHSYWTVQDIERCGDFTTYDFMMTQKAILERWANEGKRNVTELKRINKIKPVYVRVEDGESMSVLAVSVSMNLRDYLVHATTGSVVKGSDKKVISGHTAIYMLVLADEEWLLHGIEDGATSLGFAKEQNQVETGHLKRRKAVEAGELTQAREAREIADSVIASQAPAADAAAHAPDAKPEEPVVGVEDDHHAEGQPGQVNKRVEE